MVSVEALFDWRANSSHVKYANAFVGIAKATAMTAAAIAARSLIIDLLLQSRLRRPGAAIPCPGQARRARSFWRCGRTRGETRGRPCRPSAERLRRRQSRYPSRRRSAAPGPGRKLGVVEAEHLLESERSERNLEDREPGAGG